ncbi:MULTISPECIES: hypothetical protein [Kordiimonas]|jgi:hypothetical protein|uniref:Uncharacterized protein n=1 Tax=Kordiimonas lacus TaxID=637679 RepID=A0A1G6VMF4_9PROT|nr:MULTISPECIES: hypothetical protein [Kordiimonas]SDD54738.1 hypothetical protein SAMN04488071_0786 [Kordiimonas lacus]
MTDQQQPEDDTQENGTSPGRRKRDPKFIAVGLAIGVGVGVAISNIAVGIALGLVWGVVMSRRNSDD